jgi:hypothetical protein
LRTDSSPQDFEVCITSYEICFIEKSAFKKKTQWIYSEATHANLSGSISPSNRLINKYHNALTGCRNAFRALWRRVGVRVRRHGESCKVTDSAVLLLLGEY